MKIDDNYSVNYTTETVVDRKRRRKSSRTIFTETRGALTTKRIVKSREKRFTSDIVAFCFFASLSLLLGSFFFEGYFNSLITSTTKNEIITNNINGVDYDYNVSYVDYNYEKKLVQLSNFKNVFDTQTISSVATDSLRIPNEDGINFNTPYIDTAVRNGYIYVSSIEVIDLNGDEQIIYYYDWGLTGSIFIQFNRDLDSELDLFVNKRNYTDYVNLFYSSDMDLSILDKVAYYFNRFFIFMNAPLIWLYNFVYDIGVFIAFITIW